MSDTNQAAAPAEVVQGNSEAARDATGEIKNQQTTETKPSTESAAEAKKLDATLATEKKAGEAKAEPGVVPDKYEFKAPEGRELDAKLIEAATPIFKELSLSNEAGQKLVDFYNTAQAGAQTAAEKVMTDMRAEWRGKIIADPALGDGKDNLRPEARANIAKAIESIGDAKAQTAFKEALDLTGAGDNPAIASALNTLGKLLSEGTLVAGGRPSPGGQTAPGAVKLTPAQRMFPNLKSSADAS